MEIKLKPPNLNKGKTQRPRICVFTPRYIRKLVSRCGDYEFEDVICEVDDVYLLTKKPNPWFSVGQSILNRFGRHMDNIFDLYRPVALLNPGLRKIELNKNFDLFFMVCLVARDVLSLNALKGWRERCQTAVLWIDEIWAGELLKYKGLLKIMSKFDYVVTGFNASVLTIQEAIKGACFCISPGIDAIRFCPYPNPPLRSIDVYSMGRRSSSVTHQALLEMADQKRIFYYYDTIGNGIMNTQVYTQHRNLIANIAKRSRYFIVHPAKIDEPKTTYGQSELGFRFFEGAAAGTIMIGERPETQTFKKHFDWSDSVIPIPHDAPNISEILTKLDSQTERLETIRINNVVNSLLRHDWVYRWKEIIDIVGMKPRPALEVREKRLKELAEVVKSHSC